MESNNNFGALPLEYINKGNVKIVILPVPFDATSTWCKGANKGPSAIIEASENMELYDIETDSEVYKNGIYTAEPFEGMLFAEDMVKAVNREAEYYIDKGKFVVTIGGEHSISIGAIKAHADAYPGLTILQLDAHADLREKYENSKYNHACVMARAREEAPIVQVGIRSMDASEKENMDESNIFYASDIANKTGWFTDVISRLSDQVYITIDLDVFDPSIMPSTGTPEPGGLLWYETLEFLKAVIDQRDVVGFDVAELCPNKNNKSPDFMAAKLIYKLLSYKFGDGNE